MDCLLLYSHHSSLWKPGMNTVLLTWHTLCGSAPPLSLQRACPLNWSFWLQHSHCCWKRCRFSKSCWRHDGNRKQSQLWAEAWFGSKNHMDNVPKKRWQASFLFFRQLKPTCSLFCPSCFYEVIAKQIITVVIIFCWGLTVSDMVLSASLSRAFEVGTIIIPTSMTSKTKPPQCLVIHYYSMWCLCLAGWRWGLGDVKDDAWTNRKQNDPLLWSPSLHILTLDSVIRSKWELSLLRSAA